MNVILVGGAGDGTRIEVPDGIVHVDLPVRSTVDSRVTIPEYFRQEVQHYHLFKLHPTTRDIVFSLAGMTPTQILERLLGAYPSSKDELLAKLEACQQNDDDEAAHFKADQALLAFINDDEITKAFEAVVRHYA